MSSSEGHIKSSKDNRFDLGLLEKKDAQIEGKNYTVSSLSSTKTGLTLVTMHDTKQFMEPLIRTRNIFIMGMLGVLSIGLILSYRMGKRQYQPIEKIEAAFKKIAAKEELLEGNEWSLIEKRVLDVVAQHQNLNETLSRQRRFLLDDFLTKLLEGQYQDEAYVAKRMTELGEKLTGGQYFVMLMDQQLSSNKEEHVKKKTVLLEQFPIKLTGTEVFAVELPVRKQVAFIVATKSTSLSHYNHVLKLKKGLDNLIDGDISLSVGESYDKVMFLNRSYIEAMSARDFCDYSGDKNVCFFKNIIYSEPSFLSIPNELKSKMIQSFHQGDQVVALETLDKVFSHQQLRTMSSNEKKYYFFDALSTVVTCVGEFKQESLLTNFNEIINYSSSKSLFNELQVVIKSLCEAVTQEKEVQATKLESAVVVYLNENFVSHDLSLENMAIEFDFSVSYLSRFIKEQTGVTFSNYIQDLRLAFIKEQLVATNDTIKEIVLQAGYYDVSNYTRKFKNLVGVTPGQYRKSMSDSPVSQEPNN